MTEPALTDQPDARRTYDAFAASYDDFNHRYTHEQWTGRLLGKAEGAGLTGRRLLDVGCGTGLSFVAMLARGWEVTGCDISPGMIERARERAGEEATLLVADMRELPSLGEFDLVWAVDDAVNYLMSREEMEAALRGMRRNVAPAPSGKPTSRARGWRPTSIASATSPKRRSWPRSRLPGCAASRSPASWRET